MGIPSVLLGIAIMSAFGQSLFVLMLAVGLVYVPMFARTARAAVLPSGTRNTSRRLVSPASTTSRSSSAMCCPTRCHPSSCR